MVKEGITDPTSQEGINFCTEKCPYKACVALEPKLAGTVTKRMRNIEEAKRLAAKGLSVKEIAKKLGRDYRTVLGYFK